MKKLLLSIPEYMLEEIELLQPFVASTITGTIIQLIDHGINYEYKKKRKYIQEKFKKEQEEKEKNQQPTEMNQKTVDQDQEDNNKKLQQTLALAQKPIREYFDSEKDYKEQYEKWLRKFEEFI